jgi:hypothetical protein
MAGRRVARQVESVPPGAGAAEASEAEAEAWTEEEMAQLLQLVKTDVEQMDDLRSEIGMLRMMIRKMAVNLDAEEARRQIDTLCRALRTRHVLDDGAADSLSAALARTLEEVGRVLDAEQ